VQNMLRWIYFSFNINNVVCNIIVLLLEYAKLDGITTKWVPVMNSTKWLFLYIEPLKHLNMEISNKTFCSFWSILNILCQLKWAEKRTSHSTFLHSTFSHSMLHVFICNYFDASPKINMFFSIKYLSTFTVIGIIPLKNVIYK
jgi:hypothetical protein